MSFGTSNLPAGAYYDVSLESPDQQFAALVGMIEAADAQAPAPFTGTPPWGEPTDEDLIEPAIFTEQASYGPPADVEAAATTDVLALTRDAFPLDFPAPHWWNDDQLDGLGVAPGPLNDAQPIESGHTQIVLLNPAAEQGWDAWSGRTPLARVARQFNNFPGYSADVNRRHGYPAEKYDEPLAPQTQQYRDLLLAELKVRGIHNVLIADVPSVPFTEQVMVENPLDLMPEPAIGPEGVLP